MLHDGRDPYPGAIEAVDQLHAAGKHLLIISNSSRRSGGTISKLVKMGFKPECFAGKPTKLIRAAACKAADTSISASHCFIAGMG